MSVRETHSKTGRPLGLEDRNRRENGRRASERLQRSILVDLPLAVNNVTWFYTSEPLTIQRLVVLQNGTSVTWDLMFDVSRTAAVPSTVVSNVTTTATGVPDTITEFDTNLIPAGVMVWVNITGNVGAFELHISMVPVVGGG